MLATGNSSAALPATDTTDREMVFTRLLNAPRDLVWDVWTNERHVAEWWGPNGFRTVTTTFDFREGGAWVHTMIGPDGTEYPNHSIFEEIVPKERLVYQHGGGKEGAPRVCMTKIATFASAGPSGDQTVVTLTLIFGSVQEREDAVNLYGVTEGGKQTLGRLAEYIRQRMPGADEGEYFLEISRMFDAPRDLVFQAWTNPKMLAAWMGPRGFDACEVESDLRVGGTWRMCLAANGAAAPGCDARGVERLYMGGTYLESLPPEKLVFTFRWENRNVEHPDQENTVTILLRELEGKTVMDFKQGPFASADDRDGHNAGWTSAFEKFAEFMAQPVGAETSEEEAEVAASLRHSLGKAPKVAPAGSKLPAYELNLTRTFDAPRELVWRALSEPEMAKEWMGPRGFQCVAFTTGDKAGDRWQMTMEGKVPHTGAPVSLHQGGVLLEVRPPELLRYTFAWEDRSCVGLPASPHKDNEVTIRLEEQGSKTVLHFRQTPFATEEERNGHNGGWNSSFDRFAEYLAAQQPGRAPAADDVPSEMHLRRVVPGTLEQVFAAWTTAEAVQQWWGPHGFTAPVVALDVRTGGAMRIDMRGPDGTLYPMTGRFIEVYPPYRFHFISTPLDADGKVLMELWNSIFLQQVEGGVEIIVDVHVLSATPASEPHRRGMVIGWGQMMDRMAAFAERDASEIKA